MRKITDRLTKNGKRRGRRPLYLSAAQIEGPPGATKTPSGGKIRFVYHRRIGPLNFDERFLPRRRGATTLLFVQREVAKRRVKKHTKKELASLTAALAVSSKGEATASFMATIERRLRRIDRF